MIMTPEIALILTRLIDGPENPASLTCRLSRPRRLLLRIATFKLQGNPRQYCTQGFLRDLVMGGELDRK